MSGRVSTMTGRRRCLDAVVGFVAGVAVLEDGVVAMVLLRWCCVVTCNGVKAVLSGYFFFIFFV